jgi:hypothetical protein
MFELISALAGAPTYVALNKIFSGFSGETYVEVNVAVFPWGKVLILGGIGPSICVSVELCFMMGTRFAILFG